MAEQGVVLDIDTQFLQRLEKADKALGKLITSVDSVSAKFESMASGSLKNFANAMDAIVASINKVAGTKIGDMGLDNVTAKATKAADQVNNLVKATSSVNLSEHLSTSYDRISSLKAEIDQFKAWESGNLITTEDYAYIGGVADELNRMIAAHEALEETNKRLSNNRTFENYMDDLNGTSLSAQKASHELKQMSAFYKQQEKDAVALAKQEKQAAKEAEREAKREEREAKKAAKEAERQQKQAEKDAAIAVRESRTTFSGAMGYSQATGSINQQIQAIKYLKEARDKLDKTTLGQKEYKRQVSEINKEIRRQQEEVNKLTDKHTSLSGTLSKMQSLMATVFSVQAIRGYVNQIIKVRGEFELQQRALQAILQNKDEANKLWNQTVQLAVKSPFQVKELVTYTKQLAAYRVETEKLHDTTKMLADISAGLGVDMGRLILAFGQVKAANYLRGTELRQFSEAGINILDELARYYTAVEGKAVTVGQVFERVSKRMVSFADVETVLKNVTSAGGMFYQMQEIQAETLKGSISNLKDQLDLMLNDIGKSNEGVLKNSVSIISFLLKNYKALIPVLSVVALGFMGMYLNLDRVRVAATAAGKGLSSLMKGLLNPLTLGIAILSELVAEIIEYRHEVNQVVKEHKRLAESLSEIAVAMNDAFSEKSIEDARIALSRLMTTAANDFGVDFGLSNEDIQNMDLSALAGKFEELRDILFDSNVIAQKIREGYAKSQRSESTMSRALTLWGTLGIGGHGGESMATDIKQYQNSASKLLSTLQEASISISKELKLPKDHPLRRLQEADETDLQYLERLMDGFESVRDEMEMRGLDTSEIDKYYRKFSNRQEEALREAKRELDKYKEDFASMTPEAIRGAINSFVTSNEWDDYTRELILGAVGLPMVAKGKTTTENVDLEAETGVGEGAKDTRWQDLLRTIKEVNQAYKDLNKTFDATTARQGVMEKYSDALNDVLGKLLINGKKLTATEFMSMFDLTNEEGFKAALDMIAKDAPDAADKLKAKLEKGEITWEAKIKTKEESDKELIQDIEDLFSGYELSLELDKLNIPKSFAQDFFNIEAMTLPELRSKIESMRPKFVGTDMIEEYDKALTKISEMENKAQQERLKTYLQYARDAIGERAKIKLEEVKKLQEIELAFGSMDSEAKQAAQAKVREDSYQATKKFDWEEFQKSDMFVSMFESLDSASTQLTEHMIEKLRDFKDEWRDMPLEDMRSIVDKINQLESHLVEANPFAKGRELRGKVRLDGRTEADIQAENIAESEKIEAYDAEIANLETILRLKEETKVIEALQYAGSVDMADLSALSVSELRKEIKARKEARRLSADTIANNDEALRDQEMLRKAYAKQAEYLQDGQKMANDLYDAFSELMDILGGSDSPGAMFAQMGMDMANSVINCFALQLQLKSATVEAHTFGAAMNTAMGIVGWIVMGVQLIGSALGAIFKAHDKKLQKQIDKAQEDIDRLTKEYEKLEKAIDKAFSADRINDYSRAASNNIDQQIKDYERMIALEEDKKKTDNDQIDDWRDTIEELREQQREMWEETNSIITGGVLDDVRDVARNFVDAWHEAFQETGDGLSGLEDNFKDMFSEIVKQQAALHIVGSYTDMYKDWLKEYVDAEHGDVTLSAEEARAWAERVQQTFPELSTLLENFFTGTQDLMQSESEISGLSKGIQGVTETTAQVLEALLNSMRFYVADSNIRLRNIESAFANDDIANNPLLNELRQQTALVRSIEEMFSSVIGRGDSSHSGGYVKVLIG